MPSHIDQRAFVLGNRYLGLITGDAIQALKQLPSNCFNVAITSPPYFWVRDYGVKAQIGHEETVEEFVKKLADVFDEVRRVLNPEGVFYLNIGDTYYSGNGQPHGSDPRCPETTGGEIYAVFEVEEDPAWKFQDWNGAKIMDVIEAYESSVRYRLVSNLGRTSPYPRVLPLRELLKARL